MLSGILTTFSRLSKREKFIFYGAAFLISVVVLDQLILRPILSKMHSLASQIEDREGSIRMNLHIIAQKDRIKSEAAKYASFFNRAQSDEEEMALFLKEIEDIGNKSSVYVIDIKSGGFQEESVSKKYFANLNCEAQMEQLTQFFYDIESSSRLLSVEEFDLRPKTEGSSVLRCALFVSKVVLQ